MTIRNLITAVFAVLFSATVLDAQPFEKAVRRNFWNDGSNAAGLRSDSLSIANAELGATYQAGGFRNTSDPQGVCSFGALARGIKHLERFSMAGSFAFEQKEATNACGSMLPDAEDYPFDLYEFTPGHKTYQTYKAVGSISVDLTSSWRLGGTVDFKAGNVAKKKDLRYSAYLMDLTVAPSVQFVGTGCSLGASIVYNRNTRSVSAEQIGSKTTAPFVFFDEGYFSGNWQEWTASGVHLKESGVTGFPVSVNSLALALQAQFGSIYADASFGTYGAQAGEKQVVWYRYSGPVADLHFGWRKGGHSIRANVCWKGLKNNKTVLDQQTTGGVTVTVEKGANLLLDENRFEGGLEYEWLSEMWEVRAGAKGKLRKGSVTPMYPYIMDHISLNVTPLVEAVCHLGLFDLKLAAGTTVRKHSGSESADLRKLASTSSTVRPTLMSDVRGEWYEATMKYLNATSILGAASVRYNFYKGLYVEACGGIENSRWTAGLGFGYNF